MRRSPAARSFEYWLHSAKHAWRPTLISSVLSPVFYLAALGVGLGALVDRGDPSGLGGVSYLTFVAPGLLAATAMQIAAGEAGQPVRGAFQFTKAYQAMLALPAAILTGMAFATPIAAFAITQDRDLAFAALSRFVIVPMFLFSGTFFPIEELPAALEPIAYVTPLWHGVDLARELSLGTAGAGAALLHAGYLGLWLVAGLAVAGVTFRRRLRV